MLILASVDEEPLPLFQQLARGHPPRGDDVHSLSAVTEAAATTSSSSWRVDAEAQVVPIGAQRGHGKCRGVLKGGGEGRSRTYRGRYLAAVGKARVSATDEVFGNDNPNPGIGVPRLRLAPNSIRLAYGSTVDPARNCASKVAWNVECLIHSLLTPC